MSLKDKLKKYKKEKTETESKVLSQGSISMQQKHKIAHDHLNVSYELDDMCAECVFHHTIEMGKNWGVNCTPVPQKKSEIEFDDYEEEYYYKQNNDIDFFAKYELDVEQLRKAQREIMRCTSDRKVLRLPRRSGKTMGMVISMLDEVRRQIFDGISYKILVLAPQETQVKEIIMRLDEMMGFSDILTEFVVKPKGSDKYYSSSPYYQIMFKTLDINGNEKKVWIRGLTTGNSDGKSIRGQDADLIVLDEQAYLTENTMGAILPILATTGNVKLIQASTPKDKTGFFYDSCATFDAYKEIHYRFKEMEHYSKRMEEEFRRTFATEEQFIAEVEAEFVSGETSVFPVQQINNCLKDYNLHREHEVVSKDGSIYAIGVDWNESNAGTHIVISKFDKEENAIKVVAVFIVPASKFTQVESIKKIQELNDKYQPFKILVDKGYGNTQIQLLKKYGEDNPQSHMLDRLKQVDFGGSISHPYQGHIIKTPIKPLMIQITSRYLQQEKIILPKQLNGKRNSLVEQMKNYELKSMTDSKIPKYTKGYVHTLEAFFMSVYGIWLTSPEPEDFGFYSEVNKSSKKVSYQGYKSNTKSKKFKRSNRNGFYKRTSFLRGR